MVKIISEIGINHNGSIEECKKIRVFDVKGMWGLGTPEDLKNYLENYGKN